MATHLDEYARRLLTKDILLFEAPVGTEFLLGDSPLALHNEREFGAYGNLGLAVPGIEVYLPLSPALQLAFWCPSLLKEWCDIISKSRATIARVRTEQVIGRNLPPPILLEQAAELERRIFTH